MYKALLGYTDLVCIKWNKLYSYRSLSMFSRCSRSSTAGPSNYGPMNFRVRFHQPFGLNQRSNNEDRMDASISQIEACS